MNAVATRPRTLTCRTPWWPVRVNRACFSMNASASCDGRLMGPFDHGRDRRFGDRPQGDDRLHRGERQVDSRPPSVFAAGSLSRSVPASSRASIGSRPCSARKNSRATSVRTRARSAAGSGSAGRQAGRRIDRRDASCHLEPERADVTVNDLERRAQPGHLLVVAWSEVGPFQLLLAQLGQRVQTAAEQRSHLLGGHRVADGQAVDPVHAGADPHPGRLTPFGVVGRQPGVTFLGRVQRSDLPGQVVIPGPGGELVEAHRHTHPKGVHAAPAVRPTRATSVGAWGVSNRDLRNRIGGT